MAGAVLPNAVAAAQGPGAWVNPYAAQRAALEAQLAQPIAPQFTPEQIAQRRADNERQYALGLLGTLSGDESAGNVGGQVLKQAVAARTPRITDKGTSDQITGEFRYHPEYQRQVLEERLAGAQNREANAEFQNYAREDAQAARAASERMAAAARADARAAAKEARDERDRYRGEDTLRGDFDKSTKAWREELDAVDKLQATIGGYAGQRMDPHAQGAVVILLNKFLDPGSVVREGEFDRVVKAGGLEGRAKLLLDRTLKGDILTPEAVQQINQLGTIYQQAAAARMQRAGQQFDTLARQRGLGTDAVILDPRWRPGYTAPGAPAPAGKSGWSATKEN